MSDDESVRPGPGGVPWRRRLLLALAAALLTLGVLEAALWVLHPLPAPAPKVLHKYLPSWNVLAPAPRTLVWDPGPLAGVTRGLVACEVNRFGFLYPEERRHRSAADEVRVAVVGGSTVECSALAADKRWSAVLEQRLLALLPGRPVSVLNLGSSGQDTRTHLATTCQHLTALDVDVAVFMLGANDLWRVGQEYEAMLGPDDFHPPLKVSQCWKDLWRRTQLGRHLSRGSQAPSAPQRTTPYFDEAAARYRSLPLATGELQVPAAGLRDYERNIVSLAGICREHGIAVLFTTQPTMLTPAPTAAERETIWALNSATQSMPPATFLVVLARLNEQLLATCERRGYASLDLAARIPPGLDCFYDHVHFNEAGARRVADALAEPVRRLLP